MIIRLSDGSRIRPGIGRIIIAVDDTQRIETERGGTTVVVSGHVVARGPSHPDCFMPELGAHVLVHDVALVAGVPFEIGGDLFLLIHTFCMLGYVDDVP